MNLRKINYGEWSECLELSNKKIKLIITTKVGPRIIFCGFRNGQNFFREFEEQLSQTDKSEWQIYGGHRLWHSPEVSPRTYYLDNEPVEYSWKNSTITLKCPEESTNQIRK